MTDQRTQPILYREGLNLKLVRALIAFLGTERVECGILGDTNLLARFPIDGPGTSGRWQIRR
jgi:hypothetical protein